MNLHTVEVNAVLKGDHIEYVGIAKLDGDVLDTIHTRLRSKVVDWAEREWQCKVDIISNEKWYAASLHKLQRSCLSQK